MAKKKTPNQRLAPQRIRSENRQKHLGTQNRAKQSPKKLLRESKSKAPNLSIVVGIGASAGGLEAMKDLLYALPADTGMAFILVQHLDKTHGSLGPEILSRATQMPVHEVKDGMLLEANHLYVTPPNSDMELIDGVLRLFPLRTGSHGQPLVIDLFFQSLALSKKRNAIGIILSGTASDGTVGLKAIKSQGGLVIVQEPRSAKYSGMPESAIALGVVDLILPPERIAQELARISELPNALVTWDSIYPKPLGMQPDSNAEDEGKTQNDLEPTDGLRKIFAILRAQTLVDFSNYKRSTVSRRIQRRMLASKSENIDVYAQCLKEHPSEVQALFSDLLIHVTEFFRDPDSFEALETSVFPALLKNRKPDHPIRIWVPGCSSGEEAYSIAILLLEFLEKSKARIPIQIFATCLGAQVLQTARAGIYSKDIETAVSKERLDTFFEKVEGGYKISKTVRDLCLFSKHDVTIDPPFSKLDLVSCRNVLIYFSAVLQKQVIPLFHYALKPGSFLFLGRAEGSVGPSRLFAVVDKAHGIFAKINVPTPISLRTPQVYQFDIKKSEQAADHRKDGSSFQRDTEKVALLKYAPPSVTVNASMEILQYSGRTAPCIEPSTGLASNNLFKMARQELVHGLRNTLQSAIKKNESARVEGLSFDVEGIHKTFNIEVVPGNPAASPRQRNYIIFFEESSSSPNKKPPRGPILGKESQRNAKLVRELTAAQETIKSMAEEFETNKEELTSANEELQSTNEELLSSTEELETSKEELQSANEELNTVNDELQSRNSDLVVLSSELNNLLNNVELPVVTVGNDLRIRRFTPQAEKIFNLISSDVGRPLRDIKPNFESALESMVSKAIDLLSSQETEIYVDKSRWMRAQVRPYRTTDDRIDGAVITLVDITGLKTALSEVQTAFKNATSVADTLRLPLVVLDAQLRILSANQGFGRIFEIIPHKDIGADLMSVLGGKGWKIPRLRELLGEVIGKNHELVDYKIEHDFPGMGNRVMLLNARQIVWEGAMPKALLLSIDDISNRTALEQSLERSEDRFRKVVDSAHDAIVIVNDTGLIEFANQQTFSLFGYAAGELEGKVFEILIPNSIGKVHASSIGSDEATPRERLVEASFELFGRKKNGSEVPVDISLSPFKTGTETKVTVILRDITETKKLANERKALFEQERAARAAADQSKCEAERANAAKDDFLSILSHELRTPLTSILSWAQLLRSGKLDAEKTKHGIQVLEQSAKTQGQLIDDLLDISRIQAGKIELDIQKIEPIKIITNAIDATRSMAEKKSIQIEVSVDPLVKVILADPIRLQQVFWNLITNAIKFSPQGGRIWITLSLTGSDPGQQVIIQVRDNGKGIKPDFLPVIFERFSQVESSTTRSYGGLGLGLAIVRQLVAMHKGTITVESPGEGKGTSFSILLPYETEADSLTDSDAHTETQAEAEVSLSGLHVLLVEDEESSREAFAMMLQALGAEVKTADSAAAALAVIEEFKPDVLVSDIGMPMEDGYSLIARVRGLKSEAAKTPAIAVSAFAGREDIKRAMTAGFQSHLAKPVEGNKLALAIARLATSLNVLFVDDEKGMCDMFVEAFALKNVEVTTFTNPEKALAWAESNQPDLIFLDYIFPGTSGDEIAFKFKNKAPIFLLSGLKNPQTKYPFLKTLHKPLIDNEIWNVIEKCRTRKRIYSRPGMK